MAVHHRSRSCQGCSCGGRCDDMLELQRRAEGEASGMVLSVGGDCKERGDAGREGYPRARAPRTSEVLGGRAQSGQPSRPAEGLGEGKKITCDGQPRAPGVRTHLALFIGRISSCVDRVVACGVFRDRRSTLLTPLTLVTV